MNEPRAVEITRNFFKSTKFPNGSTVSHLVTDTHHTLVDRGGMDPYQRIQFPLQDTVLHPDLVGYLSNGVGVLAVEVKGQGDLLKGVIQAEQYKEGAHYSFLAIPSERTTDFITHNAKKKNIGLLRVSSDVQPVIWPKPERPWDKLYRSVRHQLITGKEADDWRSAFVYNLPTHYLAWAVALDPGIEYSIDDLPSIISEYESMPKDWFSALRGSSKLGLTRMYSNSVRLLPTGVAVKDILNTSLEEWNQVHKKSIHHLLVGVMPRAAAALRILLLRDKMIQLIVEGIRRHKNYTTSMDRLAQTCDSIDHDRAPLLFFNPEHIPSITDKFGHIKWNLVENNQYRSTTFYQVKRILQNAGILENTGLQSNSVKGYDPELDIWQLKKQIHQSYSTE